MSCKLFADIGNSRVHVMRDEEIEHLSHEEFLALYGKCKVDYISVSSAMTAKLRTLEGFRDLGPFMHLEGAYEGMGVDRRCASLAYSDAVVVDAGSAITVDVVKNSSYQGGFLYPGISHLKRCFGTISQALKIENLEDIKSNTPPYTTTKQISYGIIVPITEHIKSLANRYGLEIYLCGGDAALLHHYLPQATLDEAMLFRVMRQIAKKIDSKDQR